MASTMEAPTVEKRNCVPGLHSNRILLEHRSVSGAFEEILEVLKSIASNAFNMTVLCHY